MKTGLLFLLFTGFSTVTFSIGHPHNLFAARKAFLTRHTESRRATSAPLPRGLGWANRYSYTLSPPFSQIPHVRE